MTNFTAFVSWPSAPLTNRLVRTALDTLSPPPAIVTTLGSDLVSLPGRLLQWATYDELEHDLTFSQAPGARVLSSSYVIRKALIRKHFLSRCIHNYLTKHPDSILSWGVPRSWELEISFADELDELWGDDLYDLSDEIDKSDASKWWILKPGMADRGMGIRLFHTKDELQAIFEEFEQGESDNDDEDENGPGESGRDTAVVTSQLRHFVIQEYLGNPLLFDPAEVPLNHSSAPQVPNLRGHKFHLRVYCVASGALTVYVYDRILALFSAVPYTAPSTEGRDIEATTLDLSPHLTNTSLHTDRGEAGVRLLSELVGAHVLSSHSSRKQQPRPRRAMGQILEAETIGASRREQAEQGFEDRGLIFTADDVSRIKDQISEVLSETFKAAVEMSVHFQPVPNAFELYGVDFVVTHNPAPNALRKFQVNLLEVNSEPAIELTGPRLTWILEDLFKSIAHKCVAPFFKGTSAEAADTAEVWEVGEAKENLRKCLDLQVRGTRGW
ncbi:tubulin-tyrosine ligase [Trametes maxima]|nr:tubulin-tyrosine ligase [Trametes maxima]